ncbi:hypothetical protein LINGRAHAP2_LOCUS26299 [Linum grandiflorum]
MKSSQKDPEKLIWDQMRSPSHPNSISGPVSQARILPKLMVSLLLFVTITYVFYTLKLVSTSQSCNHEPFTTSTRHLHLSLSADNHSASELALARREIEETPSSKTTDTATVTATQPTDIQHVVFGIAASAKLWEQRKNYIKIWYKADRMRGVVWLDDEVAADDDADALPPIKISADTSKFVYKNKQGHRSAIRISRIVSETLRLGLDNVRWFVMGDDDTVFVTENLVRILRKYDHTQYYYIGSLSESHLQNIYFSYGMAYGGGGFAISYPLAVALEKMQDRCIQRYPGLYGSDDRMQACMAELGVPLTKEVGFHQYDVYGNLFGLLASHPVTPLVSLHHLDVVEPIFPNATRVEALQRLTVPMKMDSAGLMQQSICYDKSRSWTVSVSWGFAVQIFRGVSSPREIEMPSRTFLNWYRRADYTAYAFNTRPVSRNPCQKPFVFYLSKARFVSSLNATVSEYQKHRVPHPECRWRMADPSNITTAIVYKRPDPNLWNRSPRRNCCRVMSIKKKGTITIDVGECRDGEVSEV